MSAESSPVVARLRTGGKLAWVVFWSLVNLGPQANARPAAVGDSLAVYPHHPRMLFTKDDIPRLQEKCRKANRPEFNRLKRNVSRFMESAPSDLGDKTGRHQARLAKDLGFLYLMTGDEHYAERGKVFLKHALGIHLKIVSEGRGASNWQTTDLRKPECIAYDWLNPSMTPEERREFGRMLLEIQDHHEDETYANAYSGGYNMYENAFYTGVALYGDGVDDRRARELLATGFDWERNKMLAGRSQVAGDDGGLCTSVHYGLYQYFHVEAYFVAVTLSALGIDLRPECTNLPNLAVWLAYMRQPDYRFFKVCDYSARDYIRDGARSLYRYMLPIVSLFRDPVARAIWDPPDWTAAEEVIWKDKSVKPKGPDSSWPTGRFFQGAGMVIMRSGWDKNATCALFNCGDIYYGHQHADENSFIIFKGDVLALDSGDYEGWNWYPHDHDANYASRTYAHNTITVYDPDEEFRTPEMIAKGRDNPNDGGQLLVAPYAARRTEVGPTPDDCRRGKVLAFETSDDFVYVCGDASRAYSSHKLKSFVRQFVYCPPDLFFVLDRVISAKPEYRKRWLLHSVTEPSIKGRSFEVEFGGCRLVCHTLLPRDAVLTPVGGPGKEFWNEHNRYNYKPAKAAPSIYAGSWRVEISPGGLRTEDLFLHVLYTQFASERWRPSPDFVSRHGAVGARVIRGNKAWEVTFATKGQPGGHIKIVSGGDILVDRELTREVMPQSYIGN